VPLKDSASETALTILCRAEDGIFVDTMLAEARQRLDGRDSGFLLELVYGVLRNRARLDRPAASARSFCAMFLLSLSRCRRRPSSDRIAASFDSLNFMGSGPDNNII
jgi:hypothetical protein